MSRILLLLAHSIEEYDQLRLLSDIGHDVFSIGAYTDPAHPSDDKRPALPEVAFHPELAELVEGDQMAHKAHLPAGIIDWAEIIIAHHFTDAWVGGQWDRIKHKRVIWRTTGQSHPGMEAYMASFRGQGLQIVRYSPKERNIPSFAGEDTLIRFYKDPVEWNGWRGEEAVVGNVTQDMAQRADACGYDFWVAATKGLPVKPAGPGSKMIGGVGSLSYEGLREYLRSIRCYLYTGTQPASYTLGLIEAMMTGVPVVSIGPAAWARGVGWLGGLFEGHELTANGTDDPPQAKAVLSAYLLNEQASLINAPRRRQRAIDLFGKQKIAAEWQAFLS